MTSCTFLNNPTQFTEAIILVRLEGNEAAQDAQLLQLEAKHAAHPRITRNVTDGRGLSGG